MKFKFKLNHIALVSFLFIIAIVLISGAVNYTSQKKMIIENFISKYVDEIQQVREFYRLKFDKLQHDFIVMESRNIEKLEQLYAIQKREKDRFDIVKAAEELNKNTRFGSYQVFLIDRNYTIVQSSYPEDLGYNLGQHRVLVDIFDTIFNQEKSIDISPIQIDSASMQFKRYLLKLSDDRKHLLQIAFVLDLDELNQGSIGASAGRKSLDLHLANDNLIQPVELKPVIQKKNSLAHGWEQTKSFLSEMSKNLNFDRQYRISALLKSDIAIDRVNINQELNRLFADEKIIHHLDLRNGNFAVYSITNGLFNKDAETKLLLRAHYSTEQIEQDLKSAFYYFFVPLILSLLALSISYLFITRNIFLNPCP